MIALPIRTHAVLIARTYLEKKGSTESPDGSNQGFWIDFFKRKFGGGVNWAWCMYMIQATLDESFEFCFNLVMLMLDPIQKAGLINNELAKQILKPFYNPFADMPDSERGHCMSVWRFARQDARLGTLTADEIKGGIAMPRNSFFILGHPDDTGHTGWVISHLQDDKDHRKDIVETVEGNKSNRIDTGVYTLESLIGKGLQGVIF